jgi:hypothetical protein
MPGQLTNLSAADAQKTVKNAMTTGATQIAVEKQPDGKWTVSWS